MAVVDDLKAARDLIADPKRWTQFDFARDAAGHDVGSKKPRAVCWCAIGAISRVSHSANKAVNTLREATLELHGKTVTQTNDTLGHAAILQAFDLAIQRAGEPL